MNKYMQERNEKGFTLIELLIAIVVVGILTAVAIVGIAGLTDKGSGSACSATLDAVKAAEAVHYANTQPNAYPASFSAMLGATKELELSGSVTLASATELDGNGWVLKATSNAPDGALTLTGYKTGGVDPLDSCK